MAEREGYILLLRAIKAGFHGSSRLWQVNIKKIIISVTRTTCFSISRMSRFTRTIIRPHSVRTHSIDVTIICVGSTFVNI